jgi:hypothetical protein
LSLYLIQYHAIKYSTRIKEQEIELHAYVTSALDGVSGQLHGPAALPQGRAHWIGDWVGLTPALDAEEKRKIPCLCSQSNPIPQSSSP